MALKKLRFYSLGKGEFLSVFEREGNVKGKRDIWGRLGQHCVIGFAEISLQTQGLGGY